MAPKEERQLREKTDGIAKILRDVTFTAGFVGKRINVVLLS